jgi:hypothetical protein
MSLLRFTITWLMIVIVFATLAGAAYYRESAAPPNSDICLNTQVWSNTFYTLTVGSLAVSTLTAIARTGRARTRFLGFALFAWAYLQLAWDSEFDRNRSEFIHTQLLYHAVDRFTSFGAHDSSNSVWSPIERMHTIVHSLLTLVAGLVGIAIGQLVASGVGCQDEKPRSDATSVLPGKRLLRSSIAGGMLSIAGTALAIAAYREAAYTFGGRLWTNVFYTLTVGSVAASALMAIARGGRARVRVLGFALFGWAYLQYGWNDNVNAPQFIQAQVAHERLDWLIDLKGSPQDSSHIRWQVIQSVLTLGTGVMGIAVGHLVAIQAERENARSPLRRTNR